jgi:hypothetical protein
MQTLYLKICVLSRVFAFHSWRLQRRKRERLRRSQCIIFAGCRVAKPHGNQQKNESWEGEE